MISKELLEAICCVESGADLIVDGDYLVSTDINTRRRYRIENGIPILLIEQSEKLDLETWKNIMKKHGKTFND
ncbi:Trm112 family protein [Melioribacteraceae bacterium 4301-Me]|uniref:Trm112 family protein n=1 Tax=Pyranulibacter aquaticus TaxID=3163344 RepID=UPI0035973D87